MNASILVILAASIAIARMMKRPQGLNDTERKAIVKATAEAALSCLDAVTEKAKACSPEFTKMVREECLEFFIGKAVTMIQQGVGLAEAVIRGKAGANKECDSMNEVTHA